MELLQAIEDVDDLFHSKKKDVYLKDTNAVDPRRVVCFARLPAAPAVRVNPLHLLLTLHGRMQPAGGAGVHPHAPRLSMPVTVP